jgi:hypothetical protein
MDATQDEQYTAAMWRARCRHLDATITELRAALATAEEERERVIHSSLDVVMNYCDKHKDIKTFGEFMELTNDCGCRVCLASFEKERDEFREILEEVMEELDVDPKAAYLATDQVDSRRLPCLIAIGTIKKVMSALAAADEDARRRAIENLPSVEELREFADKHRPPQEWYDEDFSGLMDPADAGEGGRDV